MKKLEPMSESHTDWYNIAMCVLRMKTSHRQVRQTVKHCMRQCLSSNYEVLGFSVESIKVFEQGGRPERDHVLPVQMAAEAVFPHTTERQWHALIRKHCGVCWVTRAENHRLRSVPFSDDWRSRYVEAGIALVSVEEYQRSQMERMSATVVRLANASLVEADHVHL